MKILLGHTGFIGSLLKQATEFDQQYHAKDIDKIRGAECELLVCSAAPAKPEWANKEPAADRSNLERLMENLRQVKAKRFWLISTAEVFKQPMGVDEQTKPEKEGLLAYGKHRLELEEFCQNEFGASVFRLPTVFGTGLKKNILYDLLHQKPLTHIHSDSLLQCYPVERLWDDMQKADKAGITLLHLATEPVSVHDLAQRCFGIEFVNRPHAQPTHSDLRSRYGSLWRQAGPYLYGREKVFREIGNFIEDDVGSERGNR